MKKKISILGSTGVIGKHTLEIVDQFPDQYEVMGLAAGKNEEKLLEQVRKYQPKVISVETERAAQSLSQQLRGVEILVGSSGLKTLATLKEVDVVIAGVVGFAGMESTLAALEAGHVVGLANKEAMITAGPLMRKALARNKKAKVLPIDSEHNAIFQCLDGQPRECLRKIILTCSGGPFRQHSKEDLAKVTVDQALKHPKWVMGQKITIDSATLMNKGLEMIEAKFLFDLESPQIDVVIHPQSIIHSMVEWIDGAVTASLGETVMRGPIAHVLSYPQRLPSVLKPLRFGDIKTLTFEDPDEMKFPSLTMARACLERGGTAPVVLNAANEVAVEAFLNKRLSFLGIYETIDYVLQSSPWKEVHTVDDVIEADQRARTKAMSLL